MATKTSAEKTVEASATESGLIAARERMKSGRNEPCTCGRGRKYKKCCLRADADLVQRSMRGTQPQPEAGAQAQSTVPRREDASVPGAAPSAPRHPPREVSETDRRLDELWEWFDGLSPPSAAQMDEMLEKLLAFPPEATEWNEVLHACAEKGHPDIPAVFRRIGASVPHARETGMSYLYWAAAEEFTRRGLGALLPEVAAGYERLDEHSYDADGLVHVEDLLLAGRFEAETLELAERFLPIVRADKRLMSYAPIEKCNLIFQLRAGIALRGGPDAATSPQAVAEALRRDLGDDIDAAAIDIAAQVACETTDPGWTRASFDLVTADIRESDQAWQDCLRLNGSLLRVAREAWRIDGVPPGWAFVALSRLLESVYEAQSREEAKPRKKSTKGRQESPSRNLLDYLNPAGMEERIARACPGLLGVNVARAKILVDAHGVLLEFASRYGLIAEGSATAARAELARLRGVLA